jgi:TonB family protein
MTALADVGNVVAYIAQAAIVAIAAMALPPLLRISSSRLRYGFWRATLVVCLILPWLQVPRSPSLPAELDTSGTATVEFVSSIAAVPASTFQPAAIVLSILGLGVLARILWLAVGYSRLRSLHAEGELAADDEYSRLQELLNARATVRYVDTFSHPVTFGWRKPLIVLPAALRECATPIREAVVAHELMHVRRGDWIWVVCEEVVRSVFWFHPPLWWLISKVQLAREEIVDGLVVAAIGGRRAYVEALVALSSAARMTPAPAFAWRRHLFRRIVLLTREGMMSRRRLIVSGIAAVLLAAVATWYAMNAFPLRASDLPAPAQAAAGRLERAAQPVSLDNPVPQRRSGETIKVPRELTDARATANVMVRVTVDQSGNVAEARVTWLNLNTPDPSASTQAVIDAVVSAALDGVRRWQFDPPAKPPIAFETHLTFGSGAYATHRLAGAAAPPPPPPPPPARQSLGSAPQSGAREASTEWTGLRVGRELPPPIKIRDVRPVYPQEAMDAGMHGIVVIEIRINEVGQVDQARVLRSVPMLDAAAIEAVRQWEFQPTLLNGAPTPVVMVVTVQFTLA